MSPTRAAPLEAARSLLGLSMPQLWLEYVRLGGSLPPTEIKAFLDGEHNLSDHDHDVIVQALNEHFIDSQGNHPLLYADETSPA